MAAVGVPRSAPVTAPLLRELEEAVGADDVVTDEERLLTVAKDEMTGGEPHLPEAWVRPATAASLASVLRACRDRGVTVTPRGAGTGQSGGCVPISGGVVVSFERMNAIESIDKENLTATVGAGTILETLQLAVEAEGLFYPPDPASAQWCTLGGNVAENAGGPRALRYGVTRDYLLGLNVATMAGESLKLGKKTVKGVAGYDLTSLLCGSEGTLAVISDVTVKLLPLPNAICTALLVFSSAQAGADAVAAILAAKVVPRTLEYLDAASIAALAHVDAPYAFPKDAGAALIVETDGDDDNLAFARLERAVAAAASSGVVDTLVAQDEAQRRRIWDSRKALSKATRKLTGKKISEDIVVPRSEIPAMVAHFGILGERYGLKTCAYGHAGDGNLHAQVLFHDDSERPKVEDLLHDLFRETIAMGGTITGEHGVGLAKKRFLPLEQGPAVVDLQRAIKRAFDPEGLLNPGKIFD